MIAFIRWAKFKELFRSNEEWKLLRTFNSFFFQIKRSFILCDYFSLQFSLLLFFKNMLEMEKGLIFLCPTSYFRRFRKFPSWKRRWLCLYAYLSVHMSVQLKNCWCCCCELLQTVVSITADVIRLCMLIHQLALREVVDIWRWKKICTHFAPVSSFNSGCSSNRRIEFSVSSRIGEVR